MTKVKISKWDNDIIRMSPRQLALLRGVYALQLEYRMYSSKRLENAVNSTLRNYRLSDVAKEGIRFGNEYGFFKIRLTKKKIIISSDLVRVPRKNGIEHQRIHYRKSWPATKIVSRKIKDAPW